MAYKEFNYGLSLAMRYVKSFFKYIPYGFFVVSFSAFFIHISNIGFFYAVELAIPYKIKVGDSLSWKEVNYDDAHWENEVVVKDTNWWLRDEAVLDKKLLPFRHLAISAFFQGAYEFYWDGQLIAVNGKTGTKAAEEIPGFRNCIFLIPDSLCKAGEHQIAVRLSSYHNSNRKSIPMIFIGDYLRLTQNPLVLTALMHILAGVFLVVALYYFSMYWISHRQPTFLLFSLLCFSFFGLILLEYVKFYLTFPYPYHFRRLFVISLFTISIALILPAFLLINFYLYYKKVILSLLATLYFLLFHLIEMHDAYTKVISMIGFTTSLGIVLYAIYLRRKGSQMAFYGVLACLSTHYYYDLTLFAGFFVLILTSLFSLSVQLKEEKKIQQESLLQLRLLELELLKKSIQPHFLMNTLTSLMEWIERSPKKSLRFIEAIANEMQILNEISDKKLIPITQEISLCRSHLEVMSFRKDISYQLHTTGLDETENIPPALFHTLIENGITHNRPGKNLGLFTLHFEKQKESKKYVLLAEGGNHSNEKNYKEGTGMRYVKARLEEMQPGKWELHCGPVENGWQTEIQWKSD